MGDLRAYGPVVVGEERRWARLLVDGLGGCWHDLRSDFNPIRSYRWWHSVGHDHGVLLSVYFAARYGCGLNNLCAGLRMSVWVLFPLTPSWFRRRRLKRTLENMRALDRQEKGASGGE